ncbi:hypothetical protein QZM89_28500 [Burkholderia gladioli]|uniref:hypothetical protein n=1 Tax=Burkholderia gladioli TaxID=28095 RepID=UPI00163F4AA9|nr:hypothetical protein [Burkholderia gladioli]MDN7499143.1 hypothetical protein [Burkholderia gladioli]
MAEVVVHRVHRADRDHHGANLLVNFVLTWSGVYGSYIEDGGTKAIINSVGGVLLYYLGKTVHDVRRVRRWRNRGDSVD